MPAIAIGIYTTLWVVTANGNHDAKRAALDLDLLLISGAPLNHAGRNSTGIWGVNRQGCRFSRPAPWMARGGGPPNHWRITGTPSLGEVPSGGARAFCLLLRFSKVSRCQSGTLGGRYLNNGYVLSLILNPGRLSGRLREQARSHRLIAGCQVDGRRLSGRHGSKLLHHRFSVAPKLCRYLWLSQASQLPHFYCVRLMNQRRLLTSAGTSSPAMRLRNRAVRANSSVVTGTVIASKIGINQPCNTGPDLSVEK